MLGAAWTRLPHPDRAAPRGSAIVVVLAVTVHLAASPTGADTKRATVRARIKATPGRQDKVAGITVIPLRDGMAIHLSALDAAVLQLTPISEMEIRIPADGADLYRGPLTRRSSAVVRSATGSRASRRSTGGRGDHGPARAASPW